MIQEMSLQLLSVRASAELMAMQQQRWGARASSVASDAQKSQADSSKKKKPSVSNPPQPSPTPGMSVRETGILLSAIDTHDDRIREVESGMTQMNQMKISKAEKVFFDEVGTRVALCEKHMARALAVQLVETVMRRMEESMRSDMQELTESVQKQAVEMEASKPPFDIGLCVERVQLVETVMRRMEESMRSDMQELTESVQKQAVEMEASKPPFDIGLCVERGGLSESLQSLQEELTVLRQELKRRDVRDRTSHLDDLNFLKDLQELRRENEKNTRALQDIQAVLQAEVKAGRIPNHQQRGRAKRDRLVLQQEREPSDDPILSRQFLSSHQPDTPQWNVTDRSKNAQTFSAAAGERERKENGPVAQLGLVPERPPEPPQPTHPPATIPGGSLSSEEEDPASASEETRGKGNVQKAFVAPAFADREQTSRGHSAALRSIKASKRSRTDRSGSLSASAEKLTEQGDKPLDKAIWSAVDGAFSLIDSHLQALKMHEDQGKQSREGVEEEKEKERLDDEHTEEEEESAVGVPARPHLSDAPQAPLPPQPAASRQQETHSLDDESLQRSQQPSSTAPVQPEGEEKGLQRTHGGGLHTHLRAGVTNTRREARAPQPDSVVVDTEPRQPPHPHSPPPLRDRDGGGTKDLPPPPGAEERTAAACGGGSTKAKGSSETDRDKERHGASRGVIRIQGGASKTSSFDLPSSSAPRDLQHKIRADADSEANGDGGDGKGDPATKCMSSLRMSSHQPGGHEGAVRGEMERGERGREAMRGPSEARGRGRGQQREAGRAERIGIDRGEENASDEFLDSSWHSRRGPSLSIRSGWRDLVSSRQQEGKGKGKRGVGVKGNGEEGSKVKRKEQQAKAKSAFVKTSGSSSSSNAEFLGASIHRRRMDFHDDLASESVPAVPVSRDTVQQRAASSHDHVKANLSSSEGVSDPRPAASLEASGPAEGRERKDVEAPRGSGKGLGEGRAEGSVSPETRALLQGIARRVSAQSFLSAGSRVSFHSSSGGKGKRRVRNGQIAEGNEDAKDSKEGGVSNQVGRIGIEENKSPSIKAESEVSVGESPPSRSRSHSRVSKGTNRGHRKPPGFLRLPPPKRF
uniref:Uncharacterized protein n=2 Tax=Chromera velia CCMP2878 TaxID=1169474 RepID=A0A0G4HNZ2_9ALVE|eukprot:Cvel_7741.t2-p1 / transcript=Cvel_7741.t2 / gene=Cvel_7741 / organism=Chromera_velia_CCMP2878 / gene_product=hypothetical protein / transcript_product=hypothetical protein / location=Cvel_scaffold412:6368-15967(-) / protein_length=1094 / sequence_SO=supercontig / SO=protein_coding / is_pseudo=false